MIDFGKLSWNIQLYGLYMYLYKTIVTLISIIFRHRQHEEPCSLPWYMTIKNPVHCALRGTPVLFSRQISTFRGTLLWGVLPRSFIDSPLTFR